MHVCMHSTLYIEEKEKERRGEEERGIYNITCRV